MKKIKKISGLLLASITVGGIAVCSKNVSNKFLFSLADTETVVWKHYAEVEPTAEKAGIKEYWVSCSDSSHVFTAPTGKVEIEEGVWNQDKIDSVIALNDDRLIPASPAYVPSTIASDGNGIYVMYDQTEYAWLKENVKSVSLDIDFNDSTLTNVSGGAAMTLSDVASFSIRKTASDSIFKNLTLSNGVAHVTIDSSFFDDSTLTYIRFRLKGNNNENINFTNAKVSNVVMKEKPASPAYDVPDVISSTNSLFTLYDTTKYAWLKENVKSVSMDIDFNESAFSVGSTPKSLSDLYAVSIRTDADGNFKYCTVTNGVAHVVIDSSFFEATTLTYVRFRLKGGNNNNENIAFTKAIISNIVVEAKPATPAHDVPHFVSSLTNKTVEVYTATSYAWMVENVTSVEFDVDFNVATLTSADTGTADMADLRNFALRTGAAGSSGSLVKNFAISNGVAHVVFDSTIFSNANVVLGKFLLKNKDNGNVSFTNAEIKNLVVTLKDA